MIKAFNALINASSESLFTAATLMLFSVVVIGAAIIGGAV